VDECKPLAVGREAFALHRAAQAAEGEGEYMEAGA